MEHQAVLRYGRVAGRVLRLLHARSLEGCRIQGPIPRFLRHSGAEAQRAERGLSERDAEKLAFGGRCDSLDGAEGGDDDAVVLSTRTDHNDDKNHEKGKH